MLDCKEMKTMMVTNLEILSDESSERVDVTLYRHRFCCKDLDSVYGGDQACLPSCSKTCDEVPKGYIVLWPHICSIS